MGRTIRTIEGDRLVVFVRLGTEKDGCLVAFGIGDSFVVTVDLKRGFSFHEDSGIGIVGFRFCERTRSDFIAGDTFPFGFVHIFGEALDVTFMCG